MAFGRNVGWIAIAGLTAATLAQAQPATEISSAQFADEATRFLGLEIAAHMADIKSLDPPQATVVGARTGGDFSWGTFMRAVTAWSALTGEETLAGRQLAPFLGKAGLIDARGGGKTFSQWYAALTLRRYGADLKTNALWQSLSPAEQAAWRSLLDPAVSTIAPRGRSSICRRTTWVSPRAWRPSITNWESPRTAPSSMTF